MSFHWFSKLPLTLLIASLLALGCSSEPVPTVCGGDLTDANRNGVPDCLDASVDLCPDDAAKTQAGTCGCGVSDADANSNGVPDCLDASVDLCPDDAAKTQAGACGCGVSDADANSNGIPDCLDASIDLCPEDDAKTVPGICGCGLSDADASLNGIPDCLDASLDLCPTDAAKTAPGICGCGLSDADADSNGVPDCLDPSIDLCPEDAAKTLPGTCGCGVSDEDADGSGIPDCLDASSDLCPEDDAKTLPGTCGCGVSDADADANGVPDCIDASVDLCPADPAKRLPGVCGCGLSDSDTNANGVPDCLDGLVAGAPSVPARLAVNGPKRWATADAPVTLQYLPAGNLVANAHAEAGLDGFSATGDWAVGGVDFGFSGQGFVGSHTDSILVQTIDLTAAASAAALDARVPLRLGALAASRGFHSGDHVKVTATFLSQAGADLEARVLYDGYPDIGAWDFRGALRLTDYPVGTRSVRLELLTNDAETWAGFYAAGFTAAQVLVGDHYVRFSNDAQTWSEWIPAGAKLEGWMLAAGTGVRQVFMQSFDAMTRTTSTVSDEVETIPCGDGLLEGDEACDDANPVGGDGCSANCAIEPNFTCPTVGQSCIPNCGNGSLDGGESCEDGNAVDGDGCSAGCAIEQGFACPTVGQSCRRITCGDSIVDAPESCDDGNAADADGCSATCALAAGFVCPTVGQSCRRITCGDSFLDAPENCDDGNAVDGDGCSAGCSVEPGFTCPTAGQSCRFTCGDGILDAHESCEDGNALGGDGCSATCALEAGFACPTVGQSCRHITCGDSFLDAPESCDDGNTVDGDGCSASCRFELPGPQTLSLQGSLSASSPTWIRPGASCIANQNNSVPYQTFQLTNLGSATLAVSVNAVWSFDGYLFAFEESFDPSQPTSGCILGNDDAPDTNQSRLDNLQLPAGATLTIVATSYSSGRGDFTLAVTAAQPQP